MAGELNLWQTSLLGMIRLEHGISLRQRGLQLLSACHMFNPKELRNALNGKNTAANAVIPKPQFHGPLEPLKLSCQLGS